MIVALAVLVSLPILFPPVLPLADLGGHLGRYAVQLDSGRDPVLAQWYTFRWQLLPNLGVDLLVQALGPIIGLEPTVRAVVFATAFLQFLGILSLSRVVHGRITPFAIAALPFVYAHSFLYGFLNYTLSLGLLWCSLTLWIAMSDGDTRKLRWPAFVLLATVMWTCHLVGWALLCIACGSQELMRQLQQRQSLIRAAIASIAPLSCLLAPWAVKFLSFQSPAGTGQTSDFFLMWNKLQYLFQIFRDQSYNIDVASFVVVAILIIRSWFSKWTRLDRGLMLSAVITAVCFIIVPRRLLGSYMADQRLIEPALIFALLAAGFSGKGPKHLPKILFAIAILFAGARLTVSALNLWQFGHRSAIELKVLDKLPPHSQMVFFRALRCPPPIEWTIDRWTHLSGYAIARRHAFSNDQWDIPGAQLLHVHNSVAGPFATDDTQIDYEKPCLGRPGVIAKADQVPASIPYLWVSWAGEPKPLAQWEPWITSGGSVLYRRKLPLTSYN